MLSALALILSFGQFAYSQSSFGLQAGGNIAYQKTGYTSLSEIKGHYNTRSLVGGHFGVFHKIKINKKWILSSELNLSLIGARQPYFRLNISDSTFGSDNYNNRLGYIEIPVSVQYKIYSFYLGAGPSVLFKVFAKGIDPAYNSIFQTMDVAANFLLGYRIIKKWDVNFRYNYGLLDIAKSSNNYGGSVNQTINNRSFSLSLLYNLR